MLPKEKFIRLLFFSCLYIGIGITCFTSKQPTYTPSYLDFSPVTISYKSSPKTFADFESQLEDSSPLLTSAMNNRNRHYRDLRLFIEHRKSLNEFPLENASDDFQRIVYRVRDEEQQRTLIESQQNKLRALKPSELADALKDYQQSIQKYETLELPRTGFAKQHQEFHDFQQLLHFRYPDFIIAAHDFCKAPTTLSSQVQLKDATRSLQLAISSFTNKFDSQTKLLTDWMQETTTAYEALSNSKLLTTTDFPSNIPILDKIVELMAESHPAIEQIFTNSLNSYLPKTLNERGNIIVWGIPNDISTKRTVLTEKIKLHIKGEFLPVPFGNLFVSDSDYTPARVKRITIQGRTFSNKVAATSYNTAVRTYNSNRKLTALNLGPFETLLTVLELHKADLQPEYEKTKLLLAFLRNTTNLIKNNE